MGPTIETARLVLRRWHADDRPIMHAINTDAAVVEFLGPALTSEQSDAGLDRQERSFDSRGFGLWCAQVKGGPACIGFVGLWAPDFDAPFMPCVEIGWRLASDQWGRGYAPEGATAVLAFAFDVLELDEVVSFTTVANVRSRRVMEKIGLVRDPAADFEHPNVATGDPLRPHVLYRGRRP